MLYFDRLRQEILSFGLAPVAMSTILRLLRRACGMRLLKCIVLERVAPAVTVTNPRYVGRFLTSAELQRYAALPGYELDAAFLAEAAQKGDECFAILDGQTLAAYGWYSRSMTDIEDGFRLRFAPGYVYMYKGFTAPAYRGQRLHAVGMGRALEEYCARGCQGLISYVDADNLSSLKSCGRMGYRAFGWAWLVNWWPWRWAVTSAGCRGLGFRILAEARGRLAERAAEVEMSEPLSIERR